LILNAQEADSSYALARPVSVLDAGCWQWRQLKQQQ
jgi:hypothetical protein